jgi:hypothetical protein
MDHASPDPSTVAPRTARKAPMAGPMPTTEFVASTNWSMVAYPLCGRKLWLATAFSVNFNVYGWLRNDMELTSIQARARSSKVVSRWRDELVTAALRNVDILGLRVEDGYRLEDLTSSSGTSLSCFDHCSDLLGSGHDLGILVGSRHHGGRECRGITCQSTNDGKRED